MSRLSEIENEIDRLLAAQSDWTPLARSLAAEVDARDEVITKLLAMLEPMPQEKFHTLRYAEDISHEDCCRELHRRACEIAGRTE